MNAAPPHKHACQLTGSAGRVCYLIKRHPGRVHVDVTDGGLVVWSLPDETPFENKPSVPADPLQDAPEALRPPQRFPGEPASAWLRES